MLRTKCIALMILVAVLGRSSAAPVTPTDNIPPPTGVVATGTSSTQPAVLPIHDEQIPVIPTQRQRFPIRTGGKPITVPMPSIAQDENQISENTDLSSGENPNFVFVPIISQNFYFPERSYLPMTRNFFGGDPTSLGSIQDLSLRRNIDNALIDTYFLRQNQDGLTGTFGSGGGLSITDRFSAFRDWLLSLIPFRVEFIRPGTQSPRPMSVGVPQGNIPTPVNLVPTVATNVPTTASNVQATANAFPSGMYRHRIGQNQPMKVGVPDLNQNEYFHPEAGLTNRNYQTTFNNFRNNPQIQSYPYRPNNVYPYVPTNSLPTPYGRSVDATAGNE